MFVVFMGPPGAGKGTQSRLLAQHLNIPHLSTGDVLRQACAEQTAVGREAQAYMEAGQLVPDPLMVQVVEHRLRQPDCARGCVLDGFPRTLGQAVALDRFLNGRNTPLDAVLEIRVDEGELVRRLAGRARSDDKPEIIRNRLRAFYEGIQGLLDYYNKQGLLKTVDGIGSTEQVFDRIKAAVNQQQAQ